MTFGDLKQLCSLTDGNLSRHLQVLEKAKMVEIVKGTTAIVHRRCAASRRRAASAISNIFRLSSRWFVDAAKVAKDEPAQADARV